MKIKQKGFIVPILILIIVALIVGGGIYINSQNNNSQLNNTENQNNTVDSNAQIPKITPISPSSGSASSSTGITLTASPTSGSHPLVVTFSATIDSKIYGLGPFVVNFGAGPENHAAVGLTGRIGSNIYTTEPEVYTYNSPGNYVATISKGGCVPDLSLGEGSHPSSNKGPCDLGPTIGSVTVMVK
jgi:hypothetical protein